MGKSLKGVINYEQMKEFAEDRQDKKKKKKKISTAPKKKAITKKKKKKLKPRRRQRISADESSNRFATTLFHCMVQWYNYSNLSALALAEQGVSPEGVGVIINGQNQGLDQFLNKFPKEVHDNALILYDQLYGAYKFGASWQSLRNRYKYVNELFDKIESQFKMKIENIYKYLQRPPGENLEDGFLDLVNTSHSDLVRSLNPTVKYKYPDLYGTDEGGKMGYKFTLEQKYKYGHDYSVADSDLPFLQKGLRPGARPRPVDEEGYEILEGTGPALPSDYDTTQYEELHGYTGPLEGEGSGLIEGLSEIEHIDALPSGTYSDMLTEQFENLQDTFSTSSTADSEVFVDYDLVNQTVLNAPKELSFMAPSNTTFDLKPGEVSYTESVQNLLNTDPFFKKVQTYVGPEQANILKENLENGLLTGDYTLVDQTHADLYQIYDKMISKPGGPYKSPTKAAKEYNAFIDEGQNLQLRGLIKQQELLLNGSMSDGIPENFRYTSHQELIDELDEISNRVMNSVEASDYGIHNVLPENSSDLMSSELDYTESYQTDTVSDLFNTSVSNASESASSGVSFENPDSSVTIGPPTEPLPYTRDNLRSWEIEKEIKRIVNGSRATPEEHAWVERQMEIMNNQRLQNESMGSGLFEEDFVHYPEDKGWGDDTAILQHTPPRNLDLEGYEESDPLHFKNPSLAEEEFNRLPGNRPSNSATSSFYGEQYEPAIESATGTYYPSGDLLTNPNSAALESYYVPPAIDEDKIYPEDYEGPEIGVSEVGENGELRPLDAVGDFKGELSEWIQGGAADVADSSMLEGFIGGAQDILQFGAEGGVVGGALYLMYEFEHTLFTKDSFDIFGLQIPNPYHETGQAQLPPEIPNEENLYTVTDLALDVLFPVVGALHEGYEYLVGDKEHENKGIKFVEQGFGWLKAKAKGEDAELPDNPFGPMYIPNPWKETEEAHHDPVTNLSSNIQQINKPSTDKSGFRQLMLGVKTKKGDYFGIPFEPPPIGSSPTVHNILQNAALGHYDIVPLPQPSGKSSNNSSNSNPTVQ